MDTLLALPALTIVKSDGVLTVTPGALLTYTITVRNDGYGIASGLRVRDPLPAFTTFITGSSGAILDQQVVEWADLTLPPQSELTQTLVVAVDAVMSATYTTITNTV